jgi:hypothetical protein
MRVPLFAEPAHVALLARMRLLGRAGRRAIDRRIAIVLLVAWAPLFVINLAGAISHDAASLSFFRDVGANSRLLLTVPLLIASEYFVLPSLESMAAYMRRAIVKEEDRPSFDVALAQTRRRSAGLWPSALVTIAAYAITLTVVALAPHEDLPPWWLDANAFFSPAGWWQALVSTPLVIGLMLTWLLRLALWTDFLRAVSRLKLNLVAAHPDGAAGLQFLAHSPRRFAPVALAFGIASAGVLANEVMRSGTSPVEHALVPGATAVIVTAILVSPPLVFMRVLLETWHHGVFRYGELSRRVGLAFEHRWFGAHAKNGEEALGEPDFSATTDLYSVAANALNMRLFIFDYRSAALVAVAVLLPFAPIWLIALPIDAVLHALAGFLL